MALPFFCLLALLCVALPSEAMAWGPGVHLVTGNWLLQNLGALPAYVAAPLIYAPSQFLHGLLGADIFIGKGSKAKIGHSHNWESGFSLLQRADDASLQAYAYGYLCHLAADTVAHNIFVPGLCRSAPGTGRVAHVYLEIQADSSIDWSYRDTLPLFHERESPEALDMLRHTMKRKAFPFWLYTQIYQGSIALGGNKFWRHSMTRLDKILWDANITPPSTWVDDT